MTKEPDHEVRIAALEAIVADLQQAVAALHQALTAKPLPSAPMLRSQGMLDRPKPGR